MSARENWDDDEDPEQVEAWTAVEAALPTCVNHPDRPSRVNLDSEDLCQECADAWVRGEGAHAAWLEAEEGKAP